MRRQHGTWKSGTNCRNQAITRFDRRSLSAMAIFRQLSGRMNLVGQDAQGQCCRREYPNEGGGANAFGIHDTQMRHHRAHKVEDEADAHRHTE